MTDISSQDTQDATDATDATDAQPAAELASPLSIGPVVVPNRIFMPPHGTNYADVIGSERLANYYGSRAERGVGLIIHEAVSVHPSGVPRRGKIHAWLPEAATGFRLVADAVHTVGVPSFVQLLHAGRQMSEPAGARGSWAPSSIPCRETRSPVHPMTEAEIVDVVAGFATSARNVADGGLDGVEVHAAHGYLLSAFMSPYANRRTDRYGGDLDGRMRFTLEVLDAVQSSTPDDFVVGIRVSADELVPGGLSLDDVCEYLQYLSARVSLDYVSVSLGNYTTHELIVPDHTFPPAFNAERSGIIRQAIGPIPVLVAGRVRNGEDARRVLANGQADMIGVARGLIADPDWAGAALRGEDTSIRPCIYCNEDCRTNVGKSLPLACSVNPTVGGEREAPPTRRSGEIGVVVIGGGPAGISAALRASQAGYGVVLFEATDRLGGQLNVAAADTTRAELGAYLNYLRQAVASTPIRVELGAPPPTPLTEPGYRNLVVATGAHQRRPDWAPVDDKYLVSSAWELLTAHDRLIAGQQVLVVDDGEDGWSLASTVTTLVSRGATVSLVTEGPHPGYRLPPVSQRPFRAQLETLGVVCTSAATIRELAPGVAHVQSMSTWRDLADLQYESIIYTGGSEPTPFGADGWVSAGFRVAYAGDCFAPRGLGPATRDGLQSVDGFA